MGGGERERRRGGGGGGKREKENRRRRKMESKKKSLDSIEAHTLSLFPKLSCSPAPGFCGTPFWFYENVFLLVCHQGFKSFSLFWDLPPPQCLSLGTPAWSEGESVSIILELDKYVYYVHHFVSWSGICILQVATICCPERQQVSYF